MTSKLTREQLHERARENVKALKMASRQTAFESAREEILADLQLAELALAAMDSEPVAWINGCNKSVPSALRYLAENPRPIGGESSFNTVHLYQLAREIELMAEAPLYRHAQPAPVVEREPIAWLNDAYLARGVVDGEAGSEDAGPGYIPVYREAGPQSAPVVPEEITIETATIIAYGLPTTNIGAIFKAGHDACRAAMHKAQPQNAPQNIPEIIPGWIPVSEQKPDCWCRTCRPVVLNDMRFVVCPDCGNKRCPRANDHRNACTGSNEPGQEGSAYPDTPREVKP